MSRSQKLPAFQFYPGDWRKDPGVQALSYHDRGVWFEILCLMHESEDRGKLLLNGQAMPIDALSRLLGLDNQSLNQTLTTLSTYGVTSLDPATGAIMCRRMVRDETLSRIRQNCGKLGGNPNLVNQKSNQTPTTQVNQKPTTQVNQIPTPSSSSSDQSREEEREENKTPLASLGPQGLGDKETESNVAYSRKRRERKVFVIPSLEDVEAYCIEAGLNLVDAAMFIDFYASKGWQVGKTPMSDWQAAARGWQRKAKARPVPLGEQGGKNGAHTQHRPGRYESVAQHSGRVVRELLDDLSHGEPSP